MTRYYQMKSDLYVPGRWYLSDPTDSNGDSLDWVFSEGKHAQVAGPIRVFPHEPAKPVDYTELSIENVPVVHTRVANVLADIARQDVQIIPVQIEGQPDYWHIVNVVRVVKCIDDTRSRHIAYFTESDEDAEVFAHQIGEYRSVRGMRIDPSKVGDAKVFRTWGWVAIVVSEEIKNALEQIGTTGVKFDEA